MSVEENPFLMLITDYKKPKSLAELEALTSASGLPRYFSKIHITPDRLVDAKHVSYVFATDGWEKSNVGIASLQAALPPFVKVSSNAKEVAVSDRITRALDRPVSYAAAENQRAFFLMESANRSHYLITLDFNAKAWATNCPEYNKLDKNGDRASRFDICKHLLSAIPYYRAEIMSRAKLPLSEKAAWMDTYDRCYNRGAVFEANWIYYFVKEVIPKLGFRAGHYNNDADVSEAIGYLEEKA
ncbi:MAG: hypothetical protein JRN62_03535 [Nitrososphaerota archaeon]|jgi:hypothetical protein|nr:hypothetical protein [Nitrososphaerota archaeon]MDG6948673.1 hypothetical protein [Nitrososphaerota archaeon]